MASATSGIGAAASIARAGTAGAMILGGPRDTSRSLRLEQNKQGSDNDFQIRRRRAASAQTANMRCYHDVRRSGEGTGRAALTCTDRDGGKGRGEENYFNTQQFLSLQGDWNNNTAHVRPCVCATHTLDSYNVFKGVGATALAPALSRLTGLTSLDLRCAPQRVSDMSRLSRSGTVRETHGEETMEGQGEVAST